MKHERRANPDCATGPNQVSRAAHPRPCSASGLRAADPSQIARVARSGRGTHRIDIRIRHGEGHGMRGEEKKQTSMLVLRPPEDFVPKQHPIRRIKKMADEVLRSL